MAVTVQTSIPDRLIADLMVGVIDTPAGDWIGEIKLLESNPRKPEETPWYADAAIYNGDLRIQVLYDHPDHPEGSLRGKKIIGMDDLQKGFQKLADEFPSTFGDIMDEEGSRWDANSADSWFQCVVLGDVVYG